MTYEERKRIGEVCSMLDVDESRAIYDKLACVLEDDLAAQLRNILQKYPQNALAHVRLETILSRAAATYPLAEHQW